MRPVARFAVRPAPPGMWRYGIYDRITAMWVAFAWNRRPLRVVAAGLNAHETVAPAAAAA